MLFKEKLLLSNCDSVRALEGPELRKRFLTALTFADGVVVTPNTLLDNAHMARVIAQDNVVRYLRREGSGKLVIRGFGLEQGRSLIDYYDALPGSFILSSLPGSPRKDNLDRHQRAQMAERLRDLQRVMDRFEPVIDSVSLPRESLRDEIYRRTATDEARPLFFADEAQWQRFRQVTNDAISRSEWYGTAEAFFSAVDGAAAAPPAPGSQPSHPPFSGNERFARFRAEVIDPAYNSLFAASGEGFLQDDIRYLGGVPEILLDATVSIKSLRREISLIQYPLRVFEFISSFGAGEILRYLTDEAVGYMEDKLVESGHDYLTRRNWFGMYPRLRRFMGLEVK